MRTLFGSKPIWGLLIGFFLGPLVGSLGVPACGTCGGIDATLGGAIGLAIGIWLDSRGRDDPPKNADPNVGELAI